MFVDNYIQSPGIDYEGGIVNQFSGRSFRPEMRRPFLDERNRPCVTLNTGRAETRRGPEGKLICNADGSPREFPVYKNELISHLRARGMDCPVWNATSLRKDDWIMLDRTVQRAVHGRLRAWADLAAANLFGGFDGMSKMILEHEAQTSGGSAVVDMDGLSAANSDSPRWQLEGLPLPITHSDFHFSERRLAVSRNSGTPLDATQAFDAGQRVAEMIEKVTIGITDLSSLVYGVTADYGEAAGIYGYVNAPHRITKTDLTTPTGNNPDSTLADVLAMRQLAYAQNYMGPFMLYHSTDWDKWLDDDYFSVVTAAGVTTPTRTLRERLRAIDGITDVRRLDYLTSTYTLLLVQMTPEVCQAVDGMGITTVQWEGKGGMEKFFKVMCIQVPRIRYQYVGTSTTKKTGIVHGTTA